jgi:hypothetical protein
MSSGAWGAQVKLVQHRKMMTSKNVLLACCECVTNGDAETFNTKEATQVTEIATVRIRPSRLKSSGKSPATNLLRGFANAASILAVEAWNVFRPMKLLRFASNLSSLNTALDYQYTLSNGTDCRAGKPTVRYRTQLCRVA